MQLLTKPLRAELLRRGQREDVMGLPPVVKFFTPDAACTWLIASLDADGDTMFGLCDLGVGFPELGTVSLAELITVRGQLGLPVERDLHIVFEHTLRDYHAMAVQSQHIRPL